MSTKCPECGFEDEGNFCSHCGAALPKVGIPEEGKHIANGGISVSKPREGDLEQWMTKLREGEISVKMIGASSPILQKAGEELQVVLPNISLWEPRKVSKSIGGYGGPSIRIAKGVSWRMGAFSARSEAHEEMRNIDNGVFTLTNRRIVFSGKKRSVEIRLDKILSMEPYSDGIAVRSSGSGKTQYFVGINPKQVTMTVTINERQIEEPFTGLVLQHLIEGLVKKLP